MRKIINIDGGGVAFEFNGATPILYKQQFKSDFYGDIIKMAKASKKGIVEGEKKVDTDKLDYEDIDHLGVGDFIKFAWAMAASADMKENKATVPPLQWAAKFESIPMDTLSEIMAMAVEGLESKKK